MLTRMELLTEQQRTKLEGVLAVEKHAAVDVTHHVYQDILAAAYGHASKKIGKRWMHMVLHRTRTGLPKGVRELTQLDRSMWKRRREILAHFDHSASSGPDEAINGRMKHLRGISLGFRNLGHYILRSLIHPGELQTKINAF